MKVLNKFTQILLEDRDEGEHQARLNQKKIEFISLGILSQKPSTRFPQGNEFGFSAY